MIIHERTVLPGVQKSRERHLFLFETCLILCKKNEAKEYISRTSIPISKLSFDRNSDSFSVWGSGSRVNLKPTDGSTTDDWIQRIRYQMPLRNVPLFSEIGNSYHGYAK